MISRNIHITPDKKLYFASDFHLGIPDQKSSLVREKKIISWLNDCQKDAAEIFLMGDIFDFWFEYKSVVPKGYTRLLGKIAEITDSGIPVHLFKGNHDIWAFDYLSEELNVQIHRKPQMIEVNNVLLYLAHGDGLGPGDNGYKFLKKVFENRVNQWLFRWLHPDIGARMALYFSRQSRLANVVKEGKMENSNSLENEMLFQYSKDLIQQNIRANYYIFGHRHLPTQEDIGDNAQLIILGDWLTNFTYAVFENDKLHLKKYV